MLPLALSLFVLVKCVFPLTPEQLQSQLNAAINDRNTDFYRIPNGDYYFNGIDFHISQATNFSVISSKTTTFYFNCSYGIIMSKCDNVKVSNINIDYKPVCFSQGIIDAINQKEKSLNITINDDYYPLPDKTINKIFGASVVKIVYFDSKTREMIHNQSSVNNWNHSKSLNNESPYKYKIYLKQMTTIPQIGWLLTLGPRVGHTFLTQNCSNMLYSNITVYGSCNMAVVEELGDGNNVYNNYQLIRSPQNNGKNLLTSNADGFHSNSARIGPILNNSYLSFPADDFVNVHNRMNIILQRIDDYTLYGIDTWNGNTFNMIKLNDSISFYALNTLQYIDSGIVDNIKRMNNQTLTEQAKQAYFEMEQPPYNCHWATNWSNSVVVYMMHFKQRLNINVTKYMLIEYDSNAGSKIINNHFHSGFVTLIKLKSKKSLVKNNLFEYGHGIHVAAEQTWLEGELGLDDIVIENNQFVGCGNQNQAIVIQNTAHNVTLHNNTFN